MASPSPLRSPFSALALTIFVVLALGLGSGAFKRSEGPPSLPQECQGLSPEECQALMESLPTEQQPEVRGAALAADDACRDVGYLCAELETNGSMRILHWPLDTPMIRVLVPEPDGLPPRESRALQAAAARGIRSWHGHPIPLSVQTRAPSVRPDITVEWARTIDDGRLGRADVQWAFSHGEGQMRVVGFRIATHSPGPGRAPLSPEEVELVAAHEMGHALGLPHSDDPRDVMFPTNTSTRLTARDFRTVGALYELPAGVEIRR